MTRLHLRVEQSGWAHGHLFVGAACSVIGGSSTLDGMRDFHKTCETIAAVLGVLSASVGRNAFCENNSSRAGQDVYVSSLVVYAKLAADDPLAKEYGTYPRISRYSIHSGLAPEKIDVVGILNAKESIARVTLEVSPIVGVPNWNLTEGMTEFQLLNASKTRMSVDTSIKKSIQVIGRTSLLFPELNLGALIRKWKNLGFWPVEVMFRLCIEPIEGETALANNVMELVLPVDPPD